MSAADPLKRSQIRPVRSGEPADASGDEPRAPRRGKPDGAKCTYRAPDADFFCWKYGVWYNVLDCCYRHDLKTFAGCAGCGQGEGNLKTHRDLYRNSRHLGGPARASR
jgi:hypothetical protein